MDRSGERYSLSFQPQEVLIASEWGPSGSGDPLLFIYQMKKSRPFRTQSLSRTSHMGPFENVWYLKLSLWWMQTLAFGVWGPGMLNFLQFSEIIPHKMPTVCLLGNKAEIQRRNTRWQDHGKGTSPCPTSLGLSVVPIRRGHCLGSGWPYSKIQRRKGYFKKLKPSDLLRLSSSYYIKS